MGDPLEASLQRALGDGFRIERELSGGGMSRVFLAQDLSLGRQIVVKVLSAEVSAERNAERFRREIQLIARLQHPHIVPLLAAGEADGNLYFVMPFLSGESLRARLTRDGVLAVPDAIGILREILDALSFAHARGVIHRDIKPENVLLSAGHAVVADFGVSKALVEAETGGRGLTSAGVAIGTPAYISPEQAAADPNADHRSDLYSVGVLAYEMITGATPFSGTPSELLRAHLTSNPVPVAQRRPDVPLAVQDVVMRALEKDPARRPQSADEMSAVLATALTPRNAPSTSAAPGNRVPHLHRFRRVHALALLATVGIATLGAWIWARPTVPPSAQSLVVTPFSPADGDTALIRLGQNLVALLSANLDGVGDLRVADGVSVLSHARALGGATSLANARSIARRLGARSVLHGTLAADAGRWRADVGLYSSEGDGGALVRIGATAPRDSILALADSLTWALLRAIWGRRTPPSPNVELIDTRSPAALREFLEGERLFGLAFVDKASDHYHRAATIDTTFLFAHYRYWLARVWFERPQDTALVNRLRRHIPEMQEPARTLATAALLTPSLSEQMRMYHDVVNRYPMLALGVARLADMYTHHAMRIGWDPVHAIELWRQVTRMVPSDLNAWQHLIEACLSEAQAGCADSALVRYDSLLQADVTARTMENRSYLDRIRLVLVPHDERAIDGILATYGDSVGFLADPFQPLVYAPLWGQRPELARAADVRHERLSRSGRQSWAPLTFQQAWMRSNRGSQESLDSVVRTLTRLKSSGVYMGTAGEYTGVYAIQALLGIRPADPDSVVPVHGTAGFAEASPSVRAESRWTAAVNALVRKDSVALRRHLEALRVDTGAHASIAARSVVGIARGLAGDTRTAAESLLVLEREHGDRRPKVWGAFAADRLLAAQWLTGVRRYEAADSLLRFTRGWALNGGGTLSVVAGPIHLQRSRIAEGRGDSAKAVEHARIFLATYDLAGPAAAGWFEEARGRITRLGGSLDGFPAREAPVRR